MFADHDDPIQEHRWWNDGWAGKEALSKGSNGTRVGQVRTRAGRVDIICGHRAAWAMVHGQWPGPNDIIKHKNNIKSDNRIANLFLMKQKIEATQ
jgi:hypothetical protein